MIDRWLDDGGQPYRKPYMVVLDIGRGGVLLNGHGEALVDGQPPCYVTIRRNAAGVNSTGMVYDPVACWGDD